MGRRSWYCVGHFSPPSGSSQVFKMGYVCRSLRTCTSVHVLRVLQYEVVCAWAWLGFTEPGSLVAAALCWTCRCPPSLPPIGCTCLRFSNAVHPSFSRTVLLHPSQSLNPPPPSLRRLLLHARTPTRAGYTYLFQSACSIISTCRLTMRTTSSQK